jgi:hypothetical protein
MSHISKYDLGGQNLPEFQIKTPPAFAPFLAIMQAKACSKAENSVSLRAWIAGKRSSL